MPVISHREGVLDRFQWRFAVQAEADPRHHQGNEAKQKTKSERRRVGQRGEDVSGGGGARNAAKVFVGTPGGGLQCQQPEFIAAAFRGADGAQTASGYDADTAARCFALLRDAVAAHYRDLAPEGAGRFVLSFQLREMADRSFSVSLQARDGHGGDAGVWTGDYSGVEAFAAEADASAKRIAADLARRLSGGTRRVRDEI